MGTRSSRLQEETVSTSFDKDGLKRDSCRRLRSNRPTSLMVDFSSSFEHDSEANRSRSEEGSDSDTGRQASADGSPADHHISPSLTSQNTPADDSVGSHEADGSPPDAINNETMAGEGTGRVPHRTFSERLPGGRHNSGRNVTARSARVRSAHSRPVSEAWIGLYRVNNRHGSKLKPL